MNTNVGSDPRAVLMWWIRERYDIFLKKKTGAEKPWSNDPVMQRTYFCNVRREDDKVTQFIRSFYSPHVDHPMFEYNIVLSRFLNWPPTLQSIGYQSDHKPDELNNHLRHLAELGKIWGNAYVITTHGMRMPKVDYLTHDVLEAVYRRSRAVKNWCRGDSGGGTLPLLEEIDGIGSFLAGQIIADLKNTPRHPLQYAKDWWDFVVSGPGSIRGCNWFWTGQQSNTNRFWDIFPHVRQHADLHWPENVPFICNQDLQNCLCEYDKYMRVSSGVGRSKRNYNGV